MRITEKSISVSIQKGLFIKIQEHCMVYGVKKKPQNNLSFDTASQYLSHKQKNITKISTVCQRLLDLQSTNKCHPENV